MGVVEGSGGNVDDLVGEVCAAGDVTDGRQQRRSVVRGVRDRLDGAGGVRRGLVDGAPGVVDDLADRVGGLAAGCWPVGSRGRGGADEGGGVVRDVDQARWLTVGGVSVVGEGESEPDPGGDGERGGKQQPGWCWPGLLPHHRRPPPGNGRLSS
ncbi:hypothetical protein JNW88_23490 [Micromonospora sp. ATA32]|nr:hypothetical protein [Micromonospora sp. ATA32]